MEWWRYAGFYGGCALVLWLAPSTWPIILLGSVVGTVYAVWWTRRRGRQG